MHEIGSIMLEQLLNSDSGDYRGRTLPCEKGHVFGLKQYRSKELLTVLGPVMVERLIIMIRDVKRDAVQKILLWIS